MKALPTAFIERMKNELPDGEREAFFAALDGAPHKGVRANTLKISANEFAALFPVEERVPWEENGFYTSMEKVGAHPYHFAGLFYSQEPSAMCAAPLLEVQAGERVLDLCSAPGGKGTRLAADLKGEGLIVLNEPISARAKILSQNAERMGIVNAVVTNEYPDALAERFEGYFDKIMVDAPCSGEGMFRKNAEEAISEWSEENIALCAARQAEILRAATKMLKKGGRLVYSTCTFATQEDEGQVCDYLASHPQMKLLRQEKLYPHKVRGEGHFAALFEKTDGGGRSVKQQKPFASAAAQKAYREFEREFLIGAKKENLHEVNGVLYSLPDGVFDWKGLGVLRVGLKLGEVKNGRFEPSHALAMATAFDECKNALNLPLGDERVEKYLRGETLEIEGKNGWCLVCVDGYPLGLGKRVNGTVKNHLPKGIRKR
ncbi:MAG: RsmF rRNA methyltransferase first C-terminal domain-containing protein [Clostridia bacterium]|nr:RsmF rRNA methyltransferase first C-terminal domain-containing protein [Clostridia bacterium]